MKKRLPAILILLAAFVLSACNGNNAAPPLPVQTGDTIQFGELDWRVLYVQDNAALLITENVIKNMAYHDAEEGVTWAASDIRQYLNGAFYGSFSVADRERIAATSLLNNDNQWFGTPAGNDTVDKIFLLSIEEVVQHFGDSGMFARGIDPNERTQGFMFDPDVFGIYGFGIHDRYSIARVAANVDGEVLWWWLRSPGMSAYNAAGVFYEGYILLTNILATSPTCGIRPALWLYID